MIEAPVQPRGEAAVVAIVDDFDAFVGNLSDDVQAFVIRTVVDDQKP